MKFIKLQLMFVAAMLLPCVAVGNIVITEAGRAVCVIVTGESAAAIERRAAGELQSYLEKISGARIPISEGGKGTGVNRILLGTPDSNRAIKSKTKSQAEKLADLGQEGFLIKSMGSDLIIAGNSGPAVLYGVYSFLERDLGCRWYLPGELGEIVPKQDTIVLPHVDRTERPALRFRGEHIGGGGHYNEAIADWMSRNKMNTKLTHHFAVEDTAEVLKLKGIRQDTNAHAFFWFLPADEYFYEHPEYFALQNGKRVRPGEVGAGVQLCLSNPDVARIFIEKARHFFAAHPYLDNVGITENDGGGWCECDRCNASGVSQTDRLVTFVNSVARGLAESYPDKAVYIMGYVLGAEPPSVKPHDNVFVTLYTHGRCYQHALNNPDCQMNAKWMARIRGWLTKVNPDHFMLGDMNDIDASDYLPHPIARITFEDLKFMIGEGIAGFMRATFPRNVENMKLDRYVLAKTSWDANLRYEDILDEFCTRYYGPAGGEMGNYYKALERRVQEFPRCYTKNDMSQYPELFSEPVMKELESYLNKAKALAQGDPAATRRVANEKHLYSKYSVYIVGREDIENGPINNLVTNPGFEEGLAGQGFPAAKLEGPPMEVLLEDGLMNGWVMDYHEGTGTFSIDKGGAPEGRNALRITCEGISYLRVMQPIRLKKGRKYYFSVSINADEGAGGPIWVHFPPDNNIVTWYGSTYGKWQKVVIPEFTAAQDQAMIFLDNRQSNSVRFDDVKLVEIEVGKTMKK